MADESFFSELPALTAFAEVMDPAVYRQAPDSWCLVVTDVEGSTRAIEQGRYQDVNALGVASIVAVCNAISDVELPFVFGGDGATLLCPGSRLDQLRPALRGLQERAAAGFQLRMRAGIVPIGALRAAGHPVLVARHAQSAHAVFAMFAGSGLAEGERWIKDPERGAAYAVPPGPADADFSGFQCSWEPIASTRDTILSLLVQARAEDRREAATLYRDVLGTLEQLLGGDGRPVAVRTLQLATGPTRFDAEARLRSGRIRGVVHRLHALRARARAWIGRIFLARRWTAFGFPGARYREQVVANTDFRKFDDTLRMVLDVSRVQEQALTDYLERQHAAGRLVFGLHRSPAALMTCVIREHNGNHVHFVDGADGGYALAARQLKAQRGAR